MSERYRFARLAIVLLFVMMLGGMLWLSLPGQARQVAGAGVAEGALGKEEDASFSSLLFTSEMTHHTYLPLAFKGYAIPNPRMGFCAVSGPIDQYTDISQLRGGWYVKFGVMNQPPRPSGTEFVQMVRLHQLTTCWPERLRDRGTCPYVTPFTYTLTSPQTRGEIVAIAEANPGLLWLIGNEMDRYDWGGTNPYNPGMVSPSGGQDEMLPELYAQAYHDLYNVIKGADPTAQVAIGGIIQATPARLEYLTKIWDEYGARYGGNMPVDIWNVHNFIFKEKCDDYGADVPPGYSGGCYGTIYPDEKHNDMQIFDQQIRAFRQWMKARGQQNKPLIVSEYGIVYYHAGMEDLNLVRSFMLDTFDYFMNTKDHSLGYPSDEYRLVQRWAWYSLDDDSINKYAYLLAPDTGKLTPLGDAFAGYAVSHMEAR